jgi:effector-binding domain-containing protein/carbon monoxide dehydrogenase subunit G
MKVLKRILIALVAIVVILVVIGFLLPRTRHVERSVVIDAPPCAVFAQVNGFRHFNDWSPFVAVLPGAEYDFEGPDFGVGSKITWNISEPEPESGSQTIVASTPYKRTDIELDLGQGGDAQVAYLLQPEDGGTRLTWTFDTDFGLNLFYRYFGLILDRQLGPLYAQGLANLKRIAEELPKVDWSGIDIGATEVPSTTIAYTTGDSTREPGDIAAALAAAYGRVAVFIAANGLQIAGQPIAVSNYWDDRGYGFDAAMPVSGTPTRGAGPGSAVRMGETYGGRVVRAVHVGPYTGLEDTYHKVEAFMIAHKLESNGRSWEVFVSDPGNTAEEELVTEIYQPVK